MTKFEILVADPKKICQFCGSTETTYDKKKKRFIWRKINGIYTCHKCYMKRRQLNFKGKMITVNNKQPTGICKICGRSVQKGEIKQTQFHHTQYHEDDPLKDTTELCSSCHGDQHGRKRGKDGRYAKL